MGNLVGIGDRLRAHLLAEYGGADCNCVFVERVEGDTRLLQSRPTGVCPEHGPDTIDPGPLELLRSLSSINSQKEVAATYEISPQYLSDILNGRREISAVLAERIGYQRVVTFVKKA